MYLKISVVMVKYEYMLLTELNDTVQNSAGDHETLKNKLIGPGQYYLL